MVWSILWKFNVKRIFLYLLLIREFKRDEEGIFERESLTTVIVGRQRTIQNYNKSITIKFATWIIFEYTNLGLLESDANKSV